MDFLSLASKRYSVRKFLDKPVEEDKIELILKAGNVAPTACDLQPQKILVINDKEALEKYRKCTMSHFNAPLAFLVCYDKTLCWQRDYDGKTSGEIDASIVATHMMLEAASLGIGSTWVMHFIPEAIIEEFSLPKDYEAVALLAMGYPADDVKPSHLHLKRKPISDTVKFNKF